MASVLQRSLRASACLLVALLEALMAGLLALKGEGREMRALRGVWASARQRLGVARRVSTAREGAARQGGRVGEAQALQQRAGGTRANADLPPPRTPQACCCSTQGQRLGRRCRPPQTSLAPVNQQQRQQQHDVGVRRRVAPCPRPRPRRPPTPLPRQQQRPPAT